MPHYQSRNLRKGRFSEAGRIYMVTSRTDQRRRVFSNSNAAKIVMHEISACADEGACKNLTYVVMPDHVHWLLQVRPQGELSMMVGRMKGRSALRISRLRLRPGKLWQGGFHDHAVRREEDLENLSNYVVRNPLRAGLVDSIADYPYWWSAWHERKPVRG